MAQRLPTMRCYLKGELRRYWDIAWEMIPLILKSRLKRGIRSVTSEESLDEFTVYLHDGSRLEQSEDAHGFCMLDATDEFGRTIIKISKEVEEGSERYGVTVMLHEIAHALTCIQYKWTDHEAVPVEDVESAVWCQVASWAFRDPSGYEQSDWIASFSIACLAENVEWLNLADD